MLDERFWSKVDRSEDDDSCWNWTGYKTPLGYGQFRWCGKAVGAHVLSLAEQLDRMPNGDVHHLCHNPSCVNPKHLKEITRYEHTKLHEHGFSKRTHCPSGHEYAGENLIMYQGRRYCRACKIRHNRALRLRKKQLSL